MNTQKIIRTVDVYDELIAKKTKLAVIGLGYVGLPVALELAKYIDVIGFDINQDRLNMMKQGVDPSNELKAADFENKSISFTNSSDDLKKAKFFVVAVPTPVNKHKVPDLRALKSASETIAKVLKKNDCVVYESTVYPGCTEEDCVPILEKGSGLKMGRDFKVGYSPERINPGDQVHTLANVIKVVAACDNEALNLVAKVYELVVKAGVYRASSIKVAEAAKVIENTQRDLNIALMNELAIVFDKMGISTQEVLKAAGTKWNFLRFYPGLVGGHCIGVDPYYLTYKSAALGYKPEVILSGRRINDNMSGFIAQKIIKTLIHNGKNVSKANILVMGVTFKEDVSDTRNSKVIELVQELKSYTLNVDVVDPHADANEVWRAYQLKLKSDEQLRTNYDGVVLAVKHQEYSQLEEAFFKNITKKEAFLFDIKGVMADKVPNMQYLCL